MKNKKIYIFLVIILILQILLPIIFIKNEKNIIKNGNVSRFEVDFLEVDLQNQVVNIDLETIKGDKEENPRELYYDGLTKDKRTVAYKVKTYAKSKTSYLEIVDREWLVDTNVLASNMCKTNLEQLPDNYIRGDELVTIDTSVDKDKHVHIEAEVYHLNGACIVKEIYINDENYMNYINENYYELLKIE